MRVKGVVGFLSVVSLAGALLTGGGVHAAGGTATWTDATGDHKFSTAGNWAENAVPDVGDKLVFNTVPTGTPSSYNVINDVTTAFSSVETAGSPLANWITVNLQNDLNLAANATWKIDGAKKLGVNMATGKKISVGGSFTIVQGSMFEDLAMNGGVLTLQSGTYVYGPSVVVSGAASIVVQKGAYLGCFTTETIATPVVLGGGTGTEPPMIGFTCNMGGGSAGQDPANTVTFSKVTLLDDAKYGVWGNDTLKINEIVANGHTITRMDGADGTYIPPSGAADTVTYPTKTTQLDGDKATEGVTVLPNETAVLNGSRCDVYVRAGGTLKGQGTLCSLTVFGTVSPGNSPGTITMTNNLILASGATYAVEVASKDSYDQIVAKGVRLNGAILDLKYLAGAKVAAGDTYTIISNTDGTNPVDGTFKDLPEGATFSAQGGTFKISYKGGDGNDVTLTVVSVPKVPNTGFELVKSNIGATIGGVVLTVLGLGLLARRAQAKR
jgi:hypothetical protein